MGVQVNVEVFVKVNVFVAVGVRVKVGESKGVGVALRVKVRLAGGGGGGPLHGLARKVMMFWSKTHRPVSPPLASSGGQAVFPIPPQEVLTLSIYRKNLPASWGAAISPSQPVKATDWT